MRKYQNEEERLDGTIESCYKKIFMKSEFSDILFKEIHRQFQASEWENALVYGLRELFPEPIFTIERTGGITEVEHGTDVLIKLCNPISNLNYIIAIQIKDYQDYVRNSTDIINQINKAKYWEKDGDKLIEKILIVTQAEKEKNDDLICACKENDITLIMSNELKEILTKIGLTYIARNFPYGD